MKSRVPAITALSALAALFAHGVLAQQPAPQPSAAPAPPAAAAPAIPPTWAQGRKAEQEAANLSPHPPGLTALPATEIPVDKIKVPPGFTVTVYASGMPNARSMTFGKNGTLFVGSRFPGNVYAVTPKGEAKIIAKGLYRSNGVAYRNGTLYIAELSKISKIEDVESKLDNTPAPTLVFDALPKDEPHGWKFMKLGPDGWLYFQIGAPGNIVNPPYTHAQIVRLDPDKRVLETVTMGVRNSVGMDFHPKTKQLWFTNNARDWVGDELPHDTLHHVSAKGQHHGYPYCHQGDLLDDEFGKGRSCEEFVKPDLKLGPHVAALGMRFYTGTQFPAEYRNNIFIAEHGSWNRTKKTGYNVTRVVLDDKGKVVKHEPFATGWLQGEAFWGRPADVQVAPDGALLVSDDVAGAIFRIAYKK
jgi:glucose/arabinose dehydrogenase